MPPSLSSLLCFSSLQKASLRPGSDGVVRKEHQREKNYNQSPDCVAAGEGGPIGR